MWTKPNTADNAGIFIKVKLHLCDLQHFCCRFADDYRCRPIGYRYIVCRLAIHSPYVELLRRFELVGGRTAICRKPYDLPWITVVMGPFYVTQFNPGWPNSPYPIEILKILTQPNPMERRSHNWRGRRNITCIYITANRPTRIVHKFKTTTKMK